MNCKKKIYIKSSIFLLLIGLLIFTGCAKEPVLMPEVRTPDLEKTDPATEIQDIEPSIQEPQVQTLAGILAREAWKFFELNENREALMIYDQALDQASAEEIHDLIYQIEQVLIKTDSKVINEFLENEKTSIPKPMLTYWLGVHYFIEKQYINAQKILQQFCDAFFGHYYYQSARELILLIKRETYKKDVIGCILPLSGRHAFFGQKALDGIEFAIQEMSRKLNYPLKVIVKDTQSDENRAADCVRELSDLHVAGIAGPLFKALEAGKVAQKNQIPMIAMTQNNELASLGEFLFTNSITPEMQARTLAAHSIFQLGISRFAILYPNEPYGKTYMNLFWDAVEAFNGTIHGVQAYETSQTDFSEVIQKLSGEFYPLSESLKKELMPVDEDINVLEDPSFEDALKKAEEKIVLDFDALFIPDSPQKLNLILPQLAFNDVTDIYLLGTNLWHNDQLLQGARGYHANAVITEGFFANSRNEKTRQFSHDFKKLYNRHPGYIEAIAYDTASILFEAAMDPDTDSHDSIQSLLQGRKVFEGVTGRTIFDKDGMVHKELFLITIKRDQFVEISR